jgi:amidohydrolase
MELTAFRRELHRHPELSGEELQTADTIVDALKPLSPTRILTGLGGHGVAAIFDSGTDGPTVLFRAELDALPIEEHNDIEWSSQISGKSHVCGHDGHMTMLLALGRLVSRQPVAQGRVILMFQPAEEDGTGAKAVVADPLYKEIQADWAFAIHIEPGQPFGHVSTCAGLINCASLGLKIKLIGKTAHAADPEDGVSPTQAVAKLISALDRLKRGKKIDHDFRMVTITHVQIGEPSFGVTPGNGVLYATMRTGKDDAMDNLETAVRNLAIAVANESNLGVEFEVSDNFAVSINDADAYEIAATAMEAIGVTYGDEGVPMRASEDFGVFGWKAKAAMLCLGPGKGYAALHNPDYDFPDDLIPIGSAIFDRIARDLLGTA